MTSEDTCVRCNGTGKNSGGRRCGRCGGDGRASLTERLRAENERLKTFAFGDAPEWEKANCTLKHRVREAEVERLRDALDEIVDDLSVPHRPPAWAVHALQVAQESLALGGSQAKGSEESP